jgi:GT2 family glycosyltransferase
MPGGIELAHPPGARLHTGSLEPHGGLAGRRHAPRAVVAIPVHNEVHHIAACLRALDAQTDAALDRIVLLLNNCTDGTADRVGNVMPALRTHVDIIVRDLQAREANAGFARALAMQCAAGALLDHDVLLTTDADGAVAPDWLAANLAALRQGADAVCGRAILDPGDAPLIPAHLHADDARESRLAALLDEIAWLLDPEPHDPWPRHSEHSGASIAVRVGTWRRAGGLPRVASGEDRAFIARLRQIDARVRHAPEAVVTVSGRTCGRAQGGMADTIRRRMVQQDEFTDDAIEPARDRYRRMSMRAAARLAWRSRGVDAATLAANFSVPQRLVHAAFDTAFFGQAWAILERASPVLRPRRVRFADVPAQIEVATALRDHARRIATICAPPAVLVAA